MKTKKYTNVTVLMGGYSSERDVSLVSGKACVEALKKAGYQVKAVDVSSDISQLLQQLHPKPDVVFNALHGKFGEDGRIQGILDMLEIPYTHSGMLASALAMNKAMARLVFQQLGLQVAKGFVKSRQEILKSKDLMPRPYVIKPLDQGSSLGVVILRNGDNITLQTPDILCPNQEMFLIEEYIEGCELTVAVLGNQALAVTELQPVGRFYDYESKYSAGKTRHIIPALIPAAITQLAKDWALKAHQGLGCRGLTRTDFRWDERYHEKGLYILEINTQPGMTPLSLAPEQSAYVGITFKELVYRMVEDARCDH